MCRFTSPGTSCGGQRLISRCFFQMASLPPPSLFKVLNFFYYQCFVCMYMSVDHVCAWCPWRPEEGVRYPGTGVNSLLIACKLLYGCLELNPRRAASAVSHWATPPNPLPYFCVRISYWTWTLLIQAEQAPACPPPGSACFCHLVLSYRHSLPHLAFVWMLGTQIQGLCCCCCLALVLFLVCLFCWDRVFT